MANSDGSNGTMTAGPSAAELRAEIAEFKAELTVAAQVQEVHVHEIHRLRRIEAAARALYDPAADADDGDYERRWAAAQELRAALAVDA